MDLSLIFRLSGVGILVTILNSILSKAGRDDIGLLVSVVGLIICFFMVVDITGELINTVQNVFMMY